MNKYIEYIGTEIEYTDGTKVFLKNSDNLNICILEEDSYVSVQVKDLSEKKARKLKIRLGFKEDISEKNILVNKLFDSGFKKIQEIKEDVNSKYFFSVLDDNGVGINFMNVIPAKFDSDIIFKKDEISLETVFPYSYEGEIISEKFLVSEKIPYTEAFLYNADKCKCDKEWEDVTGWGSWDYYFTSIDEESVKENVDFIYNDSDLSEKIKIYARQRGFQTAPDGIGYYYFLDNYKAYIEIIPYSKLIQDSQQRNKILFDKLFMQ